MTLSLTTLISPARLAAGILLILGIQITQNISIVFLKLTYLEVLDGPRHGKSQIYLWICLGNFSHCYVFITLIAAHQNKPPVIQSLHQITSAKGQ